MSTRGETARELAPLLGRVRALTAAYRGGGQDGFGAFGELVGVLLRTTVMDLTQVLRVGRGPERSRATVQNAAGIGVPLRLRNGHFLRLDISLVLDAETSRIKVHQSRFQYQADETGKDWVFRYDYLRYPVSGYAHPPAHLQINGFLSADVQHSHQLKKAHFAVGRVPLEAVLRTIAVQFGVGCNDGDETWMPVLAASEEAFLEIAHVPRSGPAEPE